MELKMNEYQLPEKILFNYDELKQELTEKVSMYETLVYTDEQIKEAKADKANLNKLKKALNDERIRREKEYMQPFNDFKDKINEIIRIIDKPVALIDKQVKAFEDKQKQEKQDKIIEYWKSCEKPDWLSLANIESAKWLNASTSMKTIQDEINSRLEQIANDINTLENLPEFGFEAVQVYKTTLDGNKAINEAKRMSEIAKAKAEREAEQARLKVEAEAQKASETVKDLDGGVYVQDADKQGWAKHEAPEEPKQWVKFQALLSTEDALALKDFFNSRQIQFKAV